MPTKEISDHWSRVADLGCFISGRPNPTLHHVHSGSISGIGLHRGWSQKLSDWLVMPLDEEYHTGNYGIDSGYGVLTWEKEFGTQVQFLDDICLLLDVNVWVKSGFQRDVIGPPIIVTGILM